MLYTKKTQNMHTAEVGIKLLICIVMYVKIIHLNRGEKDLHVRTQFNMCFGTHRTVI